MKAKNSFSPLDKRSYLNVTLATLGVAAGITSIVIAWPALMHIGSSLI